VAQVRGVGHGACRASDRFADGEPAFHIFAKSGIARPDLQKFDCMGNEVLSSSALSILCPTEICAAACRRARTCTQVQTSHRADR